MCTRQYFIEDPNFQPQNFEMAKLFQIKILFDYKVEKSILFFRGLFLSHGMKNDCSYITCLLFDTLNLRKMDFYVAWFCTHVDETEKKIQFDCLSWKASKVMTVECTKVTQMSVAFSKQKLNYYTKFLHLLNIGSNRGARVKLPHSVGPYRTIEDCTGLYRVPYSCRVPVRSPICKILQPFVCR